MAAIGLHATTNPGGAGEWRAEYSEALTGARVVIVPDNDGAGRSHASKVAKSVSRVASEVRVLELPDLRASGDVSDWLDSAGTPEKLKELAAAAPLWQDADSEGGGKEHEWLMQPDLPRAPEPDPIPLDALPEVLQLMARTISDSTQTPLDSAIGAVIGTVSIAVLGKANVQICPRRKWVRPVHTYVAIEQPSGTGKSPILRAAGAPVVAWELKRAKKEAPMRRWNAEKVRLAEETVKSIRRKLANGGKVKAGRTITRSMLEHATIESAKAQAKPHGDFQVLIQDCTEEEVIRIMEANAGCAASIDAEATFLELAAGRYGNGDARLAALTHGWDGADIRVNRVNRDSVHLPAAHLGLLLALQPGVLGKLLNAETLRQRGAWARFLWIAPEIHWDEIRVGEEVPALNVEAVRRYSDTITRIMDTSERSEGERHLMRMSPEAQRGVHRLEQIKIDAMRPDGPLESVPGFAGKLPDHGSRLAALLTIADRADRGEDLFTDWIPGWAMESAVRLIQAIAPHVVKVTGAAETNPWLDDLRYLLDRAVEMHGHTESDIREKARARKVFRDAQVAKNAFDALEKRHCLRRVTRDRKPGPGNNPSPIIEVHPALRASDESDHFSERSDRSELDRELAQRMREEVFG